MQRLPTWAKIQPFNANNGGSALRDVRFAHVGKIQPSRLERDSVGLRSYRPVLFRNRTRSARPWGKVATDCAIASAAPWSLGSATGPVLFDSSFGLLDRHVCLRLPDSECKRPGEF